MSIYTDRTLVAKAQLTRAMQNSVTYIDNFALPIYSLLARILYRYSTKTSFSLNKKMVLPPYDTPRLNFGYVKGLGEEMCHVDIEQNIKDFVSLSTYDSRDDTIYGQLCVGDQDSYFCYKPETSEVILLGNLDGWKRFFYSERMF